MMILLMTNLLKRQEGDGSSDADDDAVVDDVCDILHMHSSNAAMLVLARAANPSPQTKGRLLMLMLMLILNERHGSVVLLHFHHECCAVDVDVAGDACQWD